MRDDSGTETVSLTLEVYNEVAGSAATTATTMVTDAAGDRAFIVNPDNNSVSVIDLTSYALVQEIAVAEQPRSISRDANGDVWVVSALDPMITIIDGVATTASVLGTYSLPYGSEPAGVVADQMVVRCTSLFRPKLRFGALIRRRAIIPARSVLWNAAGMAIPPSGSHLYTARFISPDDAGKIDMIDLAQFDTSSTIDLQISDRPDTIASGAGLPNYLARLAVRPDGSRLLVPSKQDNTGRGLFRNGQASDPENIVRNIVSTIDVATGSENYDIRFDINDSEGATSVASLRVATWLSLPCAV